MLKSSLLFKKRSNFTGKLLGRILRIRILRIKNLKFLGYIVFMWIQTYSEIRKSALVYL